MNQKLELVEQKVETYEIDRAERSLMNPQLIRQKTEERTIDELAKKSLEHMLKEGVETVWDRFEMQQPSCKYCYEGLSCTSCAMGPCRIMPQIHRELGVCGADADLIAARNLLDTLATGAAAHSDHGREIVETLYKTAIGEAEGYVISDEAKLKKIAAELEIKVADQSNEEIGSISRTGSESFDFQKILW